ncbi:MAG: M28 family peptidase, partial [Longimicrobiales bacterium]
MSRPVLRILGVCLAASACTTADIDLGNPPGTHTITEDDLRTNLTFLASDEMGGRLTGTPELAAAADWIAQRFVELGLAPAGPAGSYFQDFDLVTFALGSGENTLAHGGSRMELGSDFYPLNISATNAASGPLVFVGYGIEAGHIPHSDLGDGDLGGRVLLMMDGEPGPDDRRSPFDGLVRSEASRDLRKVWAAEARGAAAVLFVADVANQNPADDLTDSFAGYWPPDGRRIERFSLRSWVDRVTIPVLRVSPRMAERMAQAAGQTLSGMAEAAQAPGGITPIALGPQPVRVATSVERRTHTGRNVLGMIPGGNDTLSEEVVIIAAHHDHNGADDEGVFNGADDDGSGTVGVLEIAAAYAEAVEHGHQPERTVLFAAWDAEERGLLGAWHYTEQPTYPLEQIAAVLNMDMIGRNEEVPEDGGGRFRGLEPQTAESNELAINIIGT